LAEAREGVAVEARVAVVKARRCLTRSDLILWRINLIRDVI